MTAGRRFRSLSRIGAIAAVSLLSACMLGPDFARPKAPPVTSYTDTPLPQRTQSSAVAGGAAQEFVTAMDIPGQWWTLFHSDALNALIAEALRANPSLQAAQAALEQARENLDAQRGTQLPQATASAGAARDKISDAQSGFHDVAPTYNLYNASVNVSYNLDLFGADRRAVEALGAQVDYQQFQLESAYLTLISNLVTAAITEASLRAQLAATQDIVKSEGEQLVVLQHQFELGSVSRSDVLAQEATLAQTRAQLPPLQSQLTQVRNQVIALAGRFPSQDGLDTFELGSLHLPEQLPVSLPSTLVERRPDVRAAEALMHAASAQIGVARANQFPNFALSAQYGSVAFKVADMFTPVTTVASLGANAVGTLFDGDTLYHKRLAAEAAYRQSDAQYRGTVLGAFENVANALRALDYDAEALKAQLAAERSAADSLAIARSQYQAGAITQLVVLNAEQTYQTAKIGLVRAQAARFADTAALFQALGGGWWNRNDAAQPAAAQ